jgi:hypothetical protein
VRCESTKDDPCDEHFLDDRGARAGRFVAALAHTSAKDTKALKGVKSLAHGFDLGRGGSYRFSLPLDTGDASGRRAVFVVLDTTLGPSPATGGLSAATLAFAREALTTDEDGRPLAAKHLRIVVGHHPLEHLAPESRRALEELLDTPGVIAYLARGERHAVTPHPDEKGGGFWAIETAPAAAFPGEARLLTLKVVGGGLAYLETQTFGPALAGAPDDAHPDVKRVANALAAWKKAACGEADCPPTPPAARLFFRLPGAD